MERFIALPERNLGGGWIPVVGFSGEVAVVGQGGADENMQVASLNPTAQHPVRFRIKGFTMRRNSTEAAEDRRSEVVTL